MDKEQQIAYLNSQVACAMITAIGMQAENKYCEIIGANIKYTEADFLNVIDQYSIHHNAVITQLTPQ